ncbi:N-6 DNA methylase [Planobispora rosea]|uniref:N-6 DNA methylase n=1 Tax=Planobispora rosea TaxID=35762 RepID=UPI0016700565|nr:N-6 DNA methylase [Planobispora rosea]
MSQQPEQLTAAGISRLAGVTRATVSNWRRRHADFPLPSGGTEANPTYDRVAVEAWLAARGQLPERSPMDELRAELRGLPREVTADHLSAFLLAVARMDGAARRKLIGLSDEEFLARIQGPLEERVGLLPHARRDGLTASAVPALKTVLRAVNASGIAETLDVLHERQSADGTARGVYGTPEVVADLMAVLLEGTTYPASVYDPACGSGGLLIAAGRQGSASLIGQDVSPVQADQAAVRVGALVPGSEVRIRAGDSLREDAFPGLAAEAVLCNPPYADRDWGHDELGYDARWEYGVPPKGESELAWVQHCLAHLEPGGPAVILLPPAVAERSGGRKIRAELVRRGALRAIASLPPGAAPPQHVGLHLWILRRPADDRADVPPVLFVDTAQDDLPGTLRLTTGSGKTQAVLAELARSALGKGEIRVLTWKESPHDFRRTILQHWRRYEEAPEDFETVPGVARAVPALELIDEGVDLTPSRHVRTAPPAVAPDQQAESARATRMRLRRAADALVAVSGGEEWKPGGAKAATWRTATVADLMRGGAIGLHRVTGASRGRRLTEPVVPPDGDGRRVLTAGDVVADRTASGSAEESALTELLELQRGDVVLPEMLHGGAGTARVVDDRDVGALLGPHLYLFRPDLDRLDPWFLAGFLAAEENLHSTATGSTVVRVDARRLRVPLLPLEEQRRYGRAFRRLTAMRRAANLAVRLAEETSRQLGIGLTSGSLLPPGD